MADLAAQGFERLTLRQIKNLKVEDVLFVEAPFETPEGALVAVTITKIEKMETTSSFIQRRKAITYIHYRACEADKAYHYNGITSISARCTPAVFYRKRDKKRWRGLPFC